MVGKSIIIFLYPNRFYFVKSFKITFVRILFIKIYFLAILGLLSLHLLGQKQSYFQHFTSHDGLPNNNIYDIIQDRDGFIWFSTANGISRFDGYSYKNIRNIKTNTDTFQISIVRSMYEDKLGLLWLCTEKDGLLCYNRDLGNFTQFNSKNSPLMGDKLYTMKQDRNGRLWIGGSRAFYVVQNSGSSLENLNNLIIGKDTLQFGVKSIFEDSDGWIWLGTTGGIAYAFEWDGDWYRLVKTINFHDLLNIENISGINTISEGSDGVLWFGFWYGGFCTYNKINGTLKNCKKKLIDFKDEPSIVTGIVPDGDQVFLSTWMHGLFLLNSKENTYINWKHMVSSPFGLKKNELRTIMQDRDGNLWIGTSSDAGANMLSKQSLLFDNVKVSELNTALDISAHAFEMDSAGNFYTGTKSGLYVKRKGENKDVKLPILTEQGREVSVLALEYQHSSNCLWIGTEGDGLIQYNLNSRTTIHFPSQIENENSPRANVVLDVVLTTDTTLWIGTWGGSISVLNPQTKVFRNIPLITDYYPTDVVTDIEPVGDSILWLATYGKGIQKIDLKTGKHKSYFTAPTGEYLGKGFFTQLILGKDGNIWAGTLNNGILVFSPRNGKFKLVGNDDISRINSASSFLPDNSGNIWIGCNDKLASINTADFAIKLYGRKYGIVNDSYSLGACFKTPDNHYYFGGNGYTVRFNAEEILDVEQKLSPPVITNISIKNGELKATKATEHIDTLQLKYEQNSFSLEFTALHYADPVSVKYKYRLHGFDTKWNLALSKNRIATYTNLSPGLYTFEVKASSGTNRWDADSKFLYIHIATPFWRSLWFILLVAVLSLSIIWLLISLRFRRLQRAKKKLEDLVVKRTAQITQQNEEIKSQRDSILHQKNVIERVHKETTDSINYAKRIQEAMLPSLSILKEKHPESFVYYKPRDIVSGDFYWLHSFGDKTAVAAADCTGHGVPGAFLSILGISLLNDIAKNTELSDAGNILTILREEVKLTLNNDAVQEKYSDGMDISLCIIDNTKNTISYAGAYNSMYKISTDKVLTEYKADKMPIGEHIHEAKRFTSHNFEYSPGDTIYLFTDGYYDQFGGINGKKMKSKPFKQMLTSISDLPLPEQKEYLSNLLFVRQLPHTGEEFEQTDDILVIGIRL